MAEFKVGDKVKLISGGPSMTVNNVSGSEVSCQWFNDKKELDGDIFKKEVLVHDSGPKGIRVRGL